MTRIEGELGGHIDVGESLIVIRPSGVSLQPQTIPLDKVAGVILEPPTPRLNGQLTVRYRRPDGQPTQSFPVVYRRGWSSQRMLDLAVWLQAVARTNTAPVPAARVARPIS